MSLDRETKAELQELFAKTLDERARITPVEHADHHRYITHLLHKEERKKKLREDVKKQVAGWSIVGALGAFAAWFGDHFFKLFK